MTPRIIEGFKGFLSLPHIADDDDPQGIFASMASLAAWSERQRREVVVDDDMLAGLRASTALWMRLLLHLAVIDRNFFSLAKRMAARTLVRHEPPAKVYRHMAAHLLTSEPPRKPNPTLSRDVALIIGIAVMQNRGLLPTEAEKSGPMNRSGCGLMVEALKVHGLVMTYGNVERIWLGRVERLQAAEFNIEDISNFFASCSGVKNI
jgi:hypothetical protein